ncbi:hypothetical protein JL722_13866 [Aureococcus anophagefferens]|nr:hypothetical protein JL722_13866 [Aureococcus anophagefferens]
MIHATLLPGAGGEWRRLLENVTSVVVDEAHVYVGAFGTHVIVWNPPHKPRADAAAAKRPRTSRDAWRAPAAAAAAAAARATRPRPDSGGDETEAYDSDGAKALTGEEKLRRRAAGAERRALAAALGGGRQRRVPERRSSIVECAKLFAALVEGGTRTLAFGRTRKLVELVLGYAKERLEAGRARARGPRRLGVDVGDLDATVHLGHPGSIASLWQQAGRAGRDANSTSAAIVVCWDSPIDQHFARRGGDVLAPVEPAALRSPASVLADQLVCAAAEAPLEARDRPFFALACGCSGGDCGAYDQRSRCGGPTGRCARPRRRLGGGAHAADHARAVSLRVVDPVTFSVKCGGAVVDEVPYSRVRALTRRRLPDPGRASSPRHSTS